MSKFGGHLGPDEEYSRAGAEIGLWTGAAAGGQLGAVFGPVGAIAGAVVGAVIGTFNGAGDRKPTDTVARVARVGIDALPSSRCDR